MKIMFAIACFMLFNCNINSESKTLSTMSSSLTNGATEYEPLYTAVKNECKIGKVTAVHDGDTFYIDKVSIRLSDIDAPEIKRDKKTHEIIVEKSQPFGPEATAYLEKLVLNKEVTYCIKSKDQWLRLVSRVYLNSNDDVNNMIVGNGFAWFYTKYSTNALIKASETKARELKIGLWSQEKPIPPWEWRHANKS